MYYIAERTYTEWQAYLAGGRKKYERTLYDRGYRIQYANKFNKSSDIQIVLPWLKNHPLITIHPDNTRTLYAPAGAITHWGGTFNPLRSYSIRFSIYKYTGIEVVQRNFEYKLYEQDAKITPPKIQGCRKCKQSGRLYSWCSAMHCWNIDEKGTCPLHPDITISQIDIQRGRHITLCEHGELSGHDIPKGQECYSCNGVGKRDYGSQRVSLAWDGSPIKVENGNIVKKPLTDLERIVAAYAGPTSKV